MSPKEKAPIPLILGALRLVMLLFETETNELNLEKSQHKALIPVAKYEDLKLLKLLFKTLISTHSTPTALTPTSVDFAPEAFKSVIWTSLTIAFAFSSKFIATTYKSRPVAEL